MSTVGSGATERQVRVQVERHDEHGRQQRHEEQVDGANGVQAVDDVLQVACGGVAGADARDEAAVLLHVVRRLIGVERDLGVEENGVQAVDDVLQVACGGVAGADARDEAAVLLHVVRRLIGVERDLGVEECEEHDHESV